MKLVPIDEKSANSLVRQRNVWWEGWDLMFWSPDSSGRAWTNRRAGFRHGRWGYLTRVPVNSEGKWEVPAKYVRHTS